MNSQERLTEPEAANEALIMVEVFTHVGDTDTPRDQYELASQQVSAARHILAALNDEQLLGVYEDAYALESDEGYAASRVLSDTLHAVPYLDAGRALRLYGRALGDEEVKPGAAVFMPVGLMHLTKAAGDAAVPLWRQALDHNQTVTHTIETAGAVLERRGDFPQLSDQGIEELRKA